MLFLQLHETHVPVEVYHTLTWCVGDMRSWDTLSSNNSSSWFFSNRKKRGFSGEKKEDRRSDSCGKFCIQMSCMCGIGCGHHQSVLFVSFGRCWNCLLWVRERLSPYTNLMMNIQENQTHKVIVHTDRSVHGNRQEDYRISLVLRRFSSWQLVS
jgi:hypothetical protein